MFSLSIGKLISCWQRVFRSHEIIVFIERGIDVKAYQYNDTVLILRTIFTIQR